MANLRGILSVDFRLSDDVASHISSTIWLASLASLAVTSRRLHLTTGGIWGIGILLYLLFCPHVSSFEVLQVGLLLPFCIPAKKGRLNWQELVLLFIIPLLPFTSPVNTDNRIFLFTMLLFLLWFVLTNWERATEYRNSAS